MGPDTIAQAPPLRPWSQAARLVLAALVGAWAWAVAAGQLAPTASGTVLVWMFVVDPLVGLACLALVLWRRRYPLTVTTAVMILSAGSTAAGGAALLALGSLATRRRSLPTALLAIVCVLTVVPTELLYPRNDTADALWYRVGVVPTLAVIATVAVGVAVGARREELRALRRRAELAEREQAARTAEARMAERHRIAREMHDVLAHRVSLLAMQAGALGHREDLPSDQVSLLARGVADGARQALDELRDVLGVLRSSTPDPSAPMPSLADVPALVADARSQGLDATLTACPDRADPPPPDTIGRTAYRIVQEGLTNAGKHAPGALVRVDVDGAAGDGLRVVVRDTGSTGAGHPSPPSGFGLQGLAERVTLAGGELIHGPDPDGGFTLRATLPWPARTTEGSP